MLESEPLTLRRDCEGIQIPAGTKVLLLAGTEALLTQSLGGTYTLSTHHGLVRITGKDADALGLQPAPSEAAEAPAGVSEADVEKAVWEQLRTVYDPEIPVNIVDLGLVYLCRLTPHPEGGFQVEVTMTLTAPGCGMGDVLRNDAQTKILGVPGVKEAEVKVVVEPPWNPALMSEAARLQLGMF